MTDKIGIEIRVGDVLADVSFNSRMCSPTLHVVTSFTRMFVKTIVIHNFVLEPIIVDHKAKSTNFIKINDEQLEILIERTIQTRLDYQEGRGHFTLVSREQILEKIQELLIEGEKLRNKG